MRLINPLSQFITTGRLIVALHARFSLFLAAGLTSLLGVSSAYAADHQSASHGPDPCQLLTKTEAEAVLGEPVREPEPGTLGGVQSCDYKTVKVYGGVLPSSIHIAIAPAQRNAWDAVKKIQMKEIRTVPGLGEDAYYITEELHVLIHQRSVIFEVSNYRKANLPEKERHADLEEAERAVAQKALPRMK